MRFRTFLVVTASAATLLLGGCSSGIPLKASYCAAVGAFHTDDRRNDKQLLALISAFAKEHDLHPNGPDDDPGMREFLTKRGDVALEVIFAAGNDVGSLVLLFYRNPSGNSLRTNLNAYLYSEVSPIFRVRDCKQVDGLDTPTLQ
jgi:hypothetical protein